MIVKERTSVVALYNHLVAEIITNNSFLLLDEVEKHIEKVLRSFSHTKSPDCGLTSTAPPTGS